MLLQCIDNARIYSYTIGIGGVNMANTNITIRIDEKLKVQLQELMFDLGMDMTTFFTLAARQAVREQALPFQPRRLNGNYSAKAYQLAAENTKYNEKGQAVVEQGDEWREETEWEEMFEQMKKERKS